MEHEETYHGERIIVTTRREPDGEWTSSAELIDGERRTAVPGGSDERYGSEEEAMRGAVSRAAGAVDRGRTSTGKP